MKEQHPTPTQRRIVYAFILLGSLLQLVRIAQVQSSTGEMPFLSANDRSRWCTIAALAINGNYEIDEISQIRDPETRRKTWYPIDMVMHRGADGQQHFYSSKPPLLPTIYAGIYLAIRNATGLTLMSHPFTVARLMLIIVNLLPLIALWFILSRWIYARQMDAWGTTILAAFLTLGTFLGTFVVTLNNHLIAAVCIGISLWCVDAIVVRSKPRWYLFFLCSIATSFAAANELPALSWVAAIGIYLAIFYPRKTALVYLPALLPVALGFFGTNYWAHGELRPAYAHRAVGERVATVPMAMPELGDSRVAELAKALKDQAIEISNEARVRAARRPEIRELWDESTHKRFALRETDAGTLGVYEWGDWYDYPGSYWTDEKKVGVDRGEPNRGIYIFHCLLGHHGILSLTPFWIVSLLGMGCVLKGLQFNRLFSDPQTLLAAAITATTIVAVGFYFARPLEDRNYGGVTSGFRWSFWLIPAWFWLATVGMPLLRAGWMRRCIELALAVSIFSAFYPWHNPWSSPWLMELGESMGWVTIGQ